MQMEEKDRLDQFFQAKLSGQDEGVAPNGWDLPSDRVWQGIEASLSNHKRPLAGWWRFLLPALLALLALLFAMFWFASQRQVKQLEKTIAAQRMEMQQIAAKNNPDRAGNIAMQEEATTPPEQPAAASQTSTTAPPATPAATPPGIAQTKTATPAQRSAHKGATMVEPEKPAPATAEAFLPRRTLGILQPIPTQWPPLYMPALPALTTNRWEGQTTEDQSLSGGWLPLEFSFSPVLSDRLITYKGKDIDTKFERTETSGFSWTASMLTGVHLGKNIHLLSGLDYFSYSQESTHLMAMRYTLQNAVTDLNGRRINTYTTDLPTSFGDATIEIRVADDGAANNPDLSEGRLFPVELVAGTKIRQLGVPLLLQYQGGQGTVQWLARAGLIGNWVIDGDFTLERIRVVHPGMQAQSYQITGARLSRRLKDFTLDFQLSAGAQLKLNDRLRLNLLPTFRTNVSPIFNSKKLSTNIYSWALNVGLAVQL